MKKIYFDDTFGLTDAVLEGRKTMTRRIIRNLPLFDPRQDWMVRSDDSNGKVNIAIFHNATYKYSIYPPYQPGEVMAVAQSYKVLDYSFHRFATNPSRSCGIRKEYAEKQKGWGNKMFVESKFMPHQIRITDIKAERLQDISNGDCLKEGLVEGLLTYGYRCPVGMEVYSTPREAFAAIIDKVYGKGTFENNPWVFAYSFELVK
jgi:hypothetical protein